MKENFSQATKWLLVHEGGFVNHPKDPGGATNRGVTQRVYDGYRKRVGLPTQSVKGISGSEVTDIYNSQYWSAIWGDELPAGLDYALYDFAVNSGPTRAVKFLQELLRVPADGHMGNTTMGAVRGVNDLNALITNLCVRRLAWMQTLRTWTTFGKGWARRVMGDIPGAQPGQDTGVIDRALKLAMGIPKEAIEAPKEALPGKAVEEDRADPVTRFILWLIHLIFGPKEVKA